MKALRPHCSLTNVADGYGIRCYTTTVLLVENMIRRSLASLDIIHYVEFELFRSGVELGILANKRMKVRGGGLPHCEGLKLAPASLGCRPLT